MTRHAETAEALHSTLGDAAETIEALRSTVGDAAERAPAVQLQVRPQEEAGPERPPHAGGPAQAAELKRCPACRQAKSACWCGQVRSQQPRTQVVLLQHPREARNPVGTARMAHLSLPKSELLIGVDFETNAVLRSRIEDPSRRIAVLFPGPEARPISELRGVEPLTLVVIDGTWWQARKIWRRNPTLHRLPCYRLDPERPSTYVIRSEPAPHCLSTVEAVAAALDAIEGGRSHQSMLAPLDALVARQLGHAGSTSRAPRRRARTRPHQPRRAPEPLSGRFHDALIVHAEANGWPVTMPERPPMELAYWLACRPATGERFAALVRPSAGLSPTAPTNLALSAEQFETALDAEDFVRAWQAFARPEDVWCSWGHLAAKLFTDLGQHLPGPVVDLRAWAHAVLGARPGRIEVAHAQLGAPSREPSFPGRGGRRLAMLEPLFAAVTERSR